MLLMAKELEKKFKKYPLYSQEDKGLDLEREIYGKCKKVRDCV